MPSPILDIQVLVPPTQLYIDPPVNVTSKYVQLNKKTNWVLPQCKLYRLKNWWVLADGCIFKNWQALPDSFVLMPDNQYLVNHNTKGLLALSFKYKAARVPVEGVCVLVHNSYTGYFHWMAETLPRLFLLEEHWPNITLLLPQAYNTEFCTATLALLGIEGVVWLESKVRYQVPQLWFVSTTAQQRFYNPSLVKSVRQFFLEHTKAIAPPTKAPLVYITRAKSGKRKIINEAEVVSLLSQHGFVCLAFEDYSLLQQVHICQGAQCLVSIHGAALTNVMFMQPGAKLLELRKDDGGEMHYYHTLASAVGVHYYYQFCSSNNPVAPVNTADLFVDIEELKKNIYSVLGSEFKADKVKGFER